MPEDVSAHPHLPGAEARTQEGTLVTDRKGGQRRKALAMLRRQQPGQRRAEIMADQMGALNAQLVQDRDDVRHGAREHVICADRSSHIRFTKAAQIRRDDPIAGPRQNRRHVVPNGMIVREAMKEHGHAAHRSFRRDVGDMMV